MVKKNYTKLHIIGIGFLALCGLSRWYYFGLASPPQLLSISNKAHITDAQANNVEENARDPIDQKADSTASSSSQAPPQLDEQYLNNILIPKIKSILQGSHPSPKATPFDALCFNNLISNAKYIPSNVQKVWDQFSQEPKNLIIDMQKMLPYYKLLLPDIFTEAPLSTQDILALLDTLINIFPCFEEITFEKDLFGEIITIRNVVNLGFIKEIKDRLSTKEQNTAHTRSLKKITIKSLEDSPIATYLFILYFNQFPIEGWSAQKEKSNAQPNKNQIALVKHEALPKE